MLNANEEFEIVGELYYRRFFKLRPGKSVPPECGYDSSDEDNLETFMAWRKSDMAFRDAVDCISRLQAQVRDLKYSLELSESGKEAK